MTLCCLPVEIDCGLSLLGNLRSMFRSNITNWNEVQIGRSQPLEISAGLFLIEICLTGQNIISNVI